MDAFRVIDYGHARAGYLCNAILSDMDGAVEAHWTLGRGNKLVSEARPLSREAFELLWDGIAASVGDGGVFLAHLVTDPTRLLSSPVHHVVSTVQARAGQAWQRTFMVPVSEVDPAFLGWLAALAIPARPPLGEPASKREGRLRPVHPPHPSVAGRHVAVAPRVRRLPALA